MGGMEWAPLFTRGYWTPSRPITLSLVTYTFNLPRRIITYPVIHIRLNTSTAVRPLHPQRLVLTPRKPILRGQRTVILILYIDQISTAIRILTPVTQPLRLTVTLVIIEIPTRTVTVEIQIVDLVGRYRIAIGLYQFPTTPQTGIVIRVPSRTRITPPYIIADTTSESHTRQQTHKTRQYNQQYRFLHNLDILAQSAYFIYS